MKEDSILPGDKEFSPINAAVYGFAVYFSSDGKQVADRRAQYKNINNCATYG